MNNSFSMRFKKIHTNKKWFFHPFLLYVKISDEKSNNYFLFFDMWCPLNK